MDCGKVYLLKPNTKYDDVFSNREFFELIKHKRCCHNYNINGPGKLVMREMVDDIT
jgi:hypothetical protein